MRRLAAAIDLNDLAQQIFKRYLLDVKSSKYRTDPIRKYSKRYSIQEFKLPHSLLRHSRYLINAEISFHAISGNIGGNLETEYTTDTREPIKFKISIDVLDDNRKMRSSNSIIGTIEHELSHLLQDLERLKGFRSTNPRDRYRAKTIEDRNDSLSYHDQPSEQGAWVQNLWRDNINAKSIEDLRSRIISDTRLPNKLKFKFIQEQLIDKFPALRRSIMTHYFQKIAGFSNKQSQQYAKQYKSWSDFKSNAPFMSSVNWSAEFQDNMLSLLWDRILTARDNIPADYRRRLAAGSPKWVISWSRWIVMELTRRLLNRDPKSFTEETEISFEVPAKHLELKNKKLEVVFLTDWSSSASYLQSDHIIVVEFPIETLRYVGIIDYDGHRYEDHITKLINMRETRTSLEHELVHAYRAIVNPSFKSPRSNLGQTRQLISEFPQVRREYLNDLLESRSIPQALTEDDYTVPYDNRLIRADDSEYWKKVSENLVSAFAYRYVNDEEEQHAWVADHANEIFNNYLKPYISSLDLKSRDLESAIQKFLAESEFEINLRIDGKKQYRAMLTRIYKYLVKLSIDYLQENPNDQLKIEKEFRSRVIKQTTPWIKANYDKYSESEILDKLKIKLTELVDNVYREYLSQYSDKRDRVELLKIKKNVFNQLFNRYSNMIK